MRYTIRKNIKAKSWIVKYFNNKTWKWETKWCPVELFELDEIEARAWFEDWYNINCSKGTSNKKIGVDGYVYAVQAHDTDAKVKIGFSLNPRGRMSALSTSSPVRLILKYTFPGSMIEEKLIHKELSKYKFKGEWFNNEVLKLLEPFEGKSAKSILEKWTQVCSAGEPKFMVGCCNASLQPW